MRITPALLAALALTACDDGLLDPIDDAACDARLRDAAPDGFLDHLDRDHDGVTPADGDCDDDDPTRSPERIETCGDGVDQDCNGRDLDCDDVDHDGDGLSRNAGDCDDDDNRVRIGFDEVCDALDNDCDGLTDESCVNRNR